MTFSGSVISLKLSYDKTYSYLCRKLRKMKNLFKQAFEDGLLPEAGGDFEGWWNIEGKKLSAKDRNTLLLKILKRRLYF